MSLLDVCLGTANAPQRVDADLLRIGQRVDEQLRLIKDEYERIRKDIIATADRKIREVIDVSKVIVGSFQRIAREETANISRTTQSVRDSLYSQARMQADESQINLNLLGYGYLVEQLQRRLQLNEQGGSNAGQFPSSSNALQLPRPPVPGINLGLGTGNGATTNELETTSGASVNGNARDDERFDQRLRDSGGETFTLPRTNATDAPYTLRLHDGTDIPLFVSPIASVSGSIALLAAEPLVRPGGNRNGTQSNTTGENFPFVVGESVAVGDAAAIPSSALQTSQASRPEKCNGSNITLSFPDFLATIGLTINELCNVSPSELGSIVDNYAREREDAAKQESARTNPVGIEQPGAFRYQQREQPWYRDMITWGGEQAQLFANSATEKDFIENVIKLQKTPDEPLVKDELLAMPE